jgi:hypothetical protein
MRAKKQMSMGRAMTTVLALVTVPKIGVNESITKRLSCFKVVKY